MINFNSYLLIALFVLHKHMSVQENSIKLRNVETAFMTMRVVKGKGIMSYQLICITWE